MVFYRWILCHFLSPCKVVSKYHFWTRKACNWFREQFRSKDLLALFLKSMFQTQTVSLLSLLSWSQCFSVHQLYNTFSVIFKNDCMTHDRKYFFLKKTNDRKYMWVYNPVCWVVMFHPSTSFRVRHVFLIAHLQCLQKFKRRGVQCDATR